jgi:integrase
VTSSLVVAQWNDLLEPRSAPELTPAESARLALLDAEADSYTRKVRPDNTIREYGQAWRSWKEFCRFVELPTAPATRGMLIGYVRWAWMQGLAPSTIDTRLGGIATSLRDRGHPADRDDTAQAREVLKAEQRRAAEAGERPRGRGKAPALTIHQLRAMSEACPDDLAGLRDRALILIGFSIAARRSELSGLLVADILDEEGGLRVTTRYGKKGGRSVVVVRGRNPLTDPVAAWHAWRDTAKLTPEDRAFQRVDQWGNLRGGMSAAACGGRVTECADRAGFDGIKGHSVRAGLATTARRAGRPQERIADQGGWARTSAALMEYIRHVDQWEDNATDGIGL